MCGRYSVLTEDEIIEVRSIIQEVSMRLVKDDIEYRFVPSNEVRPTDQAPIVTKTGDGVAFLRGAFGFKAWDGRGVIINARSETVAEKGMFAKHVRTGRCVVPAGAYYEWRGSAEGGGLKKKSGARKKKHLVADRDGNILFFAGLYREGENGREFVIITKPSAGDVAGLHDRMPVILRVHQLEAWLGGDMSADELARMDYLDAAVCPCDESRGGQLSLFDDAGESGGSPIK